LHIVPGDAQSPAEILALAGQREGDRDHGLAYCASWSNTSRCTGSSGAGGGELAADAVAGAPRAVSVCRNCASAEAGTSTSTRVSLSAGKPLVPEPPALLAAAITHCATSSCFARGTVKRIGSTPSVGGVKAAAADFSSELCN